MSGRAALQPAWAKLVAIAAVLAILWILGQTIRPVLSPRVVEGSGLRPES